MFNCGFQYPTLIEIVLIGLLGMLFVLLVLLAWVLAKDVFDL